MSVSTTQEKKTLAEVTGEGAAKRAGEKAVDRGLNAIADFVKKKFGERQVKIEAVFNRYLENATLRYNQIRTLATGTTPRSIIGDDSLYVSIGLDYNGNVIDTTSVDPLLQISKNILIIGSGGVGKSMLTRYLFLDTAKYEGFVPVLVELRRIGTQVSGQLSVLDLIYSCLQDFDAELPRDQFEYSLQLGKYLFLLDGFDEVKGSLAKETAGAIQSFSAKYPNNAYIVTSRPRTETSPLETFTVMNSMPLNKGQAVELASRIWEEDEKTREFCEQLEVELYEKHKDFAENPLLLTMMFLTFMRNSSIPEHLSDFYKKAYEALYSAHDNQDKGCYRRDFECKNIDENEFKWILSHFCFHTYFDEEYEFLEEEILDYLRTSLQKLGFNDTPANNYLKDLRDIVCMIIKDGDTYRFSHRSFQAYFAAYYTAHFLNDEQQKRLFSQILSEKDVYWSKQDYYTLLIQIQSARFAENALENGLRKLLHGASDITLDKYLLKTAYEGISLKAEAIVQGNKESADSRIMFRISTNSHTFNILALFHIYFEYDFSDLANGAHEELDSDFQTIRNYVNHILSSEKPLTQGKAAQSRTKRRASLLELTFDEIDKSEIITEDERLHLYETMIRCWWGNGISERISTWLTSLDAKRASLKSPSFIDDL